MEEKNTYICTGDDLEEIPGSIVDRTGLTFPVAHTNSRYIALLAKELKNYRRDSIARLPFCATVEAEAFGGDIKLGDMKAGPRVGKYAYSSVEELEDIPPMNIENGRIGEVLKAVEKLSCEGETVALCVEGPFTVITSLIDPVFIYRYIRKDSKLVHSIFEKIEQGLVGYINEGLKRGAKIISYSDSAGAIDIVGPKIYKEYSGKATCQILKSIEPMLDQAIVHLCGKTTSALEQTKMCVIEGISLEKDITYGEGIKRLINERSDIKFIGNACIKRTPFKLGSNMIWAVKLS